MISSQNKYNRCHHPLSILRGGKFDF